MHLVAGRSKVTVCGIVEPARHTTEPRLVTCVTCQRSPRMADIEVAQQHTPRRKR